EAGLQDAASESRGMSRVKAAAQAVVAFARSVLTKAAVPRAFQALEGRGGWTGLFPRSPFDFDRDIKVHPDRILANWAVYACLTLIASDIGKLRLKLVEKVGAIWRETDSPAFSPVLRKPNRFQTRQKFIENWMVSKLSRGNTYVLKERDRRGLVVAMYVLNPDLVVPLVSESGQVFYRLHPDDLARVPFDDENDVVVPASEIIHDTMVCLFHPLVGLSPIFACGLAAIQGLKIQQNSALFFTNQSRPSGLLSSESEITDELATSYRNRWNENYGGDKIGQVAVLGNGLKYQAITANAVDSQMIEQLKFTAEMVCSTFHVPPFKIGIGALPAGQKVGDMNQIYYTDCLQALMESAEALLDEGLGLTDPKEGKQFGTAFDLDDLLKMDGATQTSVLRDQVSAGIRKIDEARAVFDLPPTPGGDTCYLQQQNYSLAALAKRDSGDDPFGTAKPPALPAPESAVPPPTKAIRELRAEIEAARVADAERAAAVEVQRAAELVERDRLATEQRDASRLMAEQMLAQVEVIEARRQAERDEDARRTTAAARAVEEGAQAAKLARAAEEAFFAEIRAGLETMEPVGG
ncbi:MAG: phage portal protein, partial [Casimicrobiaceae bacterium]